MNRRSRLAACAAVPIALVTLFGCGRSGPPTPLAQETPAAAPVYPTAAPVQAPPAVSGAAPTPAASAVVAPPASPGEAPAGLQKRVPLVEGVPALDLTWPTPKRVAESGAANTTGLKAHKKKDYSGAIRAYVDALAKNPANVLARYNLACALALQGDGERALGILAQFQAAGCIPCLKRLIRAKSDDDFLSLRSNERFQKLVAAVVVQEPDYRATANVVGNALRNGDSEVLEKSLDAGLFVTFEGVIEDPSGEGPGQKRRATLTNRVELQNYVRQNRFVENPEGVSSGFRPGEVESCKDECCSLEVMCGGAADGASPIKEMCFWPVDSATALVTRVRYLTCDGT